MSDLSVWLNGGGWARRLGVLGAALVLSVMSPTQGRAQVAPETFAAEPRITDIAISPDGTRFIVVGAKEGNISATLHNTSLGNIEKQYDIVGSTARGVGWFNEFIPFVDVFDIKGAVKWGDLGGKRYSTVVIDTKKQSKPEFMEIVNSGRVMLVDEGGRAYFVVHEFFTSVTPGVRTTMQKLANDRQLVLASRPLTVQDATADPLDKGERWTNDWAVSPSGAPIARTQFDGYYDKRFELTSLIGDQPKTLIAVEGVELPLFELIMGGEDGESVIVLGYLDAEQTDGLFRISLIDGSIERLLAHPNDGLDVERVLMNRFGGQLLGAVYGGVEPSMVLVDKGLEAELGQIADSYNAPIAEPVSWTEDKQLLVLRLDSPVAGRVFLLYDRAARSVKKMGSARPWLTADSIAPVTPIAYNARDGLRIEAVLTTPPGVADPRNLPTILMPHGGPEAQDTLGYDYLAQFLANQGYAVLQPNYRGSSGRGAAFLRAGFGEFGGKMIDDMADGLDYIVEAGIADPGRACAFGASYGGYAALRLGERYPDRFACIAAFAPVTDLRAMLADERRASGSEGQAVYYWNRFMGGKEGDKEIDAQSPAKNVSAFEAPVLLMHGKDDRVVPRRQSQIMQSALKQANKEVTYLELKQEDHYLSSPDARLEMMQTLQSFLAEHLRQ